MTSMATDCASGGSSASVKYTGCCPFRADASAAAMITNRPDAGPSVGLGHLVVPNAIDDVIGLDRQRFTVVEHRRPHVSGAIGDELAVHLLRIVLERRHPGSMEMPRS